MIVRALGLILVVCATGWAEEPRKSAPVTYNPEEPPSSPVQPGRQGRVELKKSAQGAAMELYKSGFETAGTTPNPATPVATAGRAQDSLKPLRGEQQLDPTGQFKELRSPPPPIPLPITTEMAEEALPYAVLSMAVYQRGIESPRIAQNQPPWQRLSGELGDSPRTKTQTLEVWIPGTDVPRDFMIGGESTPSRIGLKGTAEKIKVEVEISFHASAYRSPDGLQVVVAFEGSPKLIPDQFTQNPSLQKWAETWVETNALQLVNPIGVPAQYTDAKNFASKIIDGNTCQPPCQVVVTGHSLGGGMAQYVAGINSLKAYTFNTAAVGVAVQNEIKGDTRRIKNIFEKSDGVHKTGTSLFGAKLYGQSYEIDSNSGNVSLIDSLVAGDLKLYFVDHPGLSHSIGRMVLALKKIARSEEQQKTVVIDTTKIIVGAKPQPTAAELARTDAGLKVKILRDKARWELQRDIAFEARETAWNVNLKIGEYQLAKSVTDAHGNRVRIEAYVLRPQPNQVQQLVLNAREQRFDYGYILSTFFGPVSGLAEAKTATRNTFNSPTMPSNYLTQYDLVATNTVDRIRQTTNLGAPAALNFGAFTRFFPATIDMTLRLTGPGYDKIKETVATTHNGTQFTYRVQFPNAVGTLADFLNMTYTPSTGVCVSCTPNLAVAPTQTVGSTTGPEGGVSSKVTFKDGTFLTTDTWWVKNDGVVSAPPRLASPLEDPKSVLKDLNLEMRITASEFTKDIDIVLPGEAFTTGATSGQDVRKN